MDEDLDDTIIVASRSPHAGPLGADTEDTVIRPRGDFSAAAPLVAAPAPPAVVRGGIHSFSVAGATYRLDAPAIIGRNPRAPRVISGDAPTLVTVLSAGKEVSSSHLEIRQRGTSVIVTDLRSTNGSSVTIPLGQPIGLRQGESIVVSPGSLVDIGDGNIIQILPLVADIPPAGRQS